MYKRFRDGGETAEGCHLTHGYCLCDVRHAELYNRIRDTLASSVPSRLAHGLDGGEGDRGGGDGSEGDRGEGGEGDGV